MEIQRQSEQFGIFEASWQPANEYGGFRNDDDTAYVGESPNKHWNEWHRKSPEEDYQYHNLGAPSADDAKRHVDQHIHGMKDLLSGPKIHTGLLNW